MASLSSSSSNLVDKLEDEVLCPVCYERFDTRDHLPKALPCFHTFCKKCLITLRDKDIDRSFPCPVCNQNCVKHQDINKYTTNLTIITMLDCIDSANKQQPEDASVAGQEPQVKTPQSKALCSEHKDKKLSQVCVECFQVFCSKCINRLIASPSTSSHQHTLEDIEDVMDIAKKTLKATEKEIDNALKETKRMDGDMEKHFKERRVALKAKIDEEANRKITMIQNKKQFLYDEIDECLQLNGSERKRWESCRASLEKMKQGIEYIESKNEVPVPYIFSLLQTCYTRKRSQGSLLKLPSSLDIRNCAVAFNQDAFPHDFIGSIIVSISSLTTVMIIVIQVDNWRRVFLAI